MNHSGEWQQREFKERLYPAFSRRATQVVILSSALEKIARGEICGEEAQRLAQQAMSQANPFGWNERSSVPAVAGAAS